MKAVFLIMAACLVGAIAVPVHPDSEKLEKIKIEIEAIREVVRTTLAEIKELIKDTNDEVREEAEPILEDARARLHAIGEELKDDLKKGKLGKLLVHVRNVRLVLQETADKLREPLSKYPELVEEVRSKVNAALEKVREHVQNIINILRGDQEIIFVDEIQNSKWEEIKAEVEAIKAVVQKTVDDVKLLVKDTNDEVREQVEAILENAKARLQAIGEQIAADIRNGELTLRKLRAHLQNLKAVLTETVEQLKEPLAKYPELIADIRATVSDAAEQVRSHVRRILEIIRGHKDMILFDEGSDSKAEKIKAEIEAIKAVVQKAVVEIKELIESVNEEVKEQVEAILAETKAKLQAIGEEIRKDVENGELTVRKLLAHVRNVKKVLHNTASQLKEALSKYPELVKEVHAKAHAAKKQVQAHVRRIIEIIREEEEMIFLDTFEEINDNWDEIRHEVKQMHAIVNKALDEINKLAQDNSKESGDEMGVIVEAGRERINGVLERLDGEFERKEITKEKFYDYFNLAVKAAQATLQDMSVVLEKYPDLAGPVENILAAGMKKLVEHLNRINKLLEGTHQVQDALNDNGDAVKVELEAIKDVVKAGFEQVKKLAANNKKAVDVETVVNHAQTRLIGIVHAIHADFVRGKLNAVKLAEHVVDVRVAFNEAVDDIKEVLLESPELFTQIKTIVDKDRTTVRAHLDNVNNLVRSMDEHIINLHED